MTLNECTLLFAGNGANLPNIQPTELLAKIAGLSTNINEERPDRMSSNNSTIDHSEQSNGHIWSSISDSSLQTSLLDTLFEQIRQQSSSKRRVDTSSYQFSDQDVGLEEETVDYRHRRWPQMLFAAPSAEGRGDQMDKLWKLAAEMAKKSDKNASDTRQVAPSDHTADSQSIFDHSNARLPDSLQKALATTGEQVKKHLQVAIQLRQQLDQSRAECESNKAKHEKELDDMRTQRKQLLRQLGSFEDERRFHGQQMASAQAKQLKKLQDQLGEQRGRMQQLIGEATGAKRKLAEMESLVKQREQRQAEQRQQLEDCVGEQKRRAERAEATVGRLRQEHQHLQELLSNRVKAIEEAEQRANDQEKRLQSAEFQLQKLESVQRDRDEMASHAAHASEEAHRAKRHVEELRSSVKRLLDERDQALEQLQQIRGALLQLPTSVASIGFQTTNNGATEGMNEHSDHQQPEEAKPGQPECDDSSQQMSLFNTVDLHRLFNTLDLYACCGHEMRGHALESKRPSGHKDQLDHKKNQFALMLSGFKCKANAS